MASKPNAPQRVESQLRDLPLKDVLNRLQTSEHGLTEAEARARLQRYGHNELAEKRTSPVLAFLRYFWGPIPWMIEIAAILSAIVRHWADFIIITVLLITNAVVGFWEEYQAGNTIAALKARLALQARVKRDGAWRGVPARELVPGDVIRLRLGEVIPADARLLPGDPVQVDQSALTGESLPVERKTGDVVYSGSILKQGEVEAVVYATGTATFFGKTAQLVQEARTVSHFQRAVLKIGNYLIVLAAALAIVIITFAVLRGESFLSVLQFVLVLTVAAIPVAMPTVLSVTMAVGARVLARREAIVTRLAAVEELAGIDVLCSDKTGTLTQNKLTLGDPYAAPGNKPEEVVLAGALASRAEDQDPIDLAVLGGIEDKEQLTRYRVVHFQPFDPVHKRTEAELTGPEGAHFRVTKGAPQVILALVQDKERVQPQVDAAVNRFAKRGFRSLGVARADADGQWHFLGVLPLFDPPRPDSKQTLAQAARLGIRTKMITGDQEAIAREIAGQLGLGTNILDARVLQQYRDTDPARLAKAVEQADGFAQVFPEHKFLIVDTLQKDGHIVGMTGDGVNDAPPLKKADAGIAVSGATDAARAAAAIVLLQPGLSIIIDAIRESRMIFQRMNNYAVYRIAETIGLLIFITLAILIFGFYPVTAIMIVLLAILNDGAIISIAYDHTIPSARPEAWNMRKVLVVAAVLGGFRVLVSFSLFYLAATVFHLPDAAIRTFIYLNLSVGGHFTVFAARTRGPFWSVTPSWVLLAAVIGTQIIATLISVYGFLLSPIGWSLAGFVWGYVLVGFLVQDFLKVAAYRFIFHERFPQRTREAGRAHAGETHLRKAA